MSRYRDGFLVSLTIALIALVSGCGSDSTSPPVPAGASAVDGTDLAATVGTAVGTLQLRVVDATGSPLSGISVAWSVTSGGGSVSPASSTTDAGGVAQTTWTLGPTAGAQSVTGTVSGLPAVTFNATAEPGAATQVIVSPSTITLDALGSTGQFSATLADANGNPIAGGTIAWSSSAVGVATVNTTGAAEAVSNGTSTITATSGEFAGTAVVTVLQAAATVEVTSPTENVEVGKTVQLTATALDANGNPLTDPELAWSSSDPAVATIDATGLVTGVTEGAATFTATAGSASGTADLTVILVLPPFEPVANMDLTGTIDASEVMIPAGVTITATGPLTINASGNVQIDGAIMGDCVAVTINGSADVLITGVINNGCTGLVGEESPGLTIVGGGEMTFDGAVLTSTGAIHLGNDLAALAAAGAVLSPSLLANSTEQGPAPCTYQSFSAKIMPNAGREGAAGSAIGGDGEDGRNIDVICTGDVHLVGAFFLTSPGGAGGVATNPVGMAEGGKGGNGGSLFMISRSGTISVLFGNSVTTGDGRNGGDATSFGNPAIAVGGAGGLGGGFLMSPSVGTGLGGLEIVRGNSGHGGDATAFGDPGEDATSAAAATTSGTVTAVGGNAGLIDSPGISPPSAQEFTLTFNDPVAGHGGDALAAGGVSGKGSKNFPLGAKGPNMTARGGAGGFILGSVQPVGTPGDGGLAELMGGNGGMGWNACEDFFFLERGGDGGPGGTLFGGNGLAGLAALGLVSGTAGPLLVNEAGNGGNGGNGAPPTTVGGAAATNSTVPLKGTVPIIVDGLRKGEDGKLCKFGFNVGIAVKAGGDPNGHEEFIELGTVGMITAELLPGGQIEFTSGSVIWIKTMGAVGADGAFNTTGAGTVAGFNGVQVTFMGTIDLDGDGKITGITGMLVYDAPNSVLPPQDPDEGDGLRHNANYNLTGTLKPPE